MELTAMLDLTHHDPAQPLQIILGAGTQRWDGWLATNQAQLDLLQREQWAGVFGRMRADAFLCEHVWEHLTEAEARQAAALCFEYLKPGGYLRVAVPDGNFPNEAYQTMAQIGGPGPADHPAADHKIVYDYQLFSDIFASAGFAVDLLEYCDAAGRFHYHQWDLASGPIYRSLLSDHRNKDGELGFVSLILDAKKPL